MATGGAIKAGEAFIELSLRGARNFGARLNSAIRSMGRLAAAAARLGVAMSAAFGAASLVGIRRFVQLGDQMQKMAMRTGMSAESLSELAFAAEQSGTNIDQLSQAMFRANRRIGNAVTETGPAVRALKELNLQASVLAELAPEDQFNALVDALSGVDNQARKSQLAFEIFGDNWRQIAPLINAGSEGIATLREQARILGRTVSTEQANKAAALADRWNEVRSIFRGFLFDIVDNFAPALESMLVEMRNFLLDWKIWLKDLQIAWQETVNGFAITFEDEINSILGALASAAGVNMFNFAGRGGTTMRQQSGQAMTELRRQRQQLIEQGRPSSAFNPTSRQADAIAEGIQEAQRRSGVSGSSFGSFSGDVRQFGIQSVGRRQLRVLQQIEDIQERQLQILEQTGFLAFL